MSQVLLIAFGIVMFTIAIYALNQAHDDDDLLF
jgi:hypothetical protein